MMTFTNASYHKTVKDICGNNVFAERWLKQAIDAATLWDHIVDKQEIDIESANHVMTGLLTEWGINPFYLKFANQLIPAMVSAISSWRFSNEEKSPKILAYAVYTEIPTVVCYLLHGQVGVDKHIPKLRQLALTMLDEDEIRDSGAK